MWTRSLGSIVRDVVRPRGRTRRVLLLGVAMHLAFVSQAFGIVVAGPRDPNLLRVTFFDEVDAFRVRRRSWRREVRALRADRTATRAGESSTAGGGPDDAASARTALLAAADLRYRAANDARARGQSAVARAEYALTVEMYDQFARSYPRDEALYETRYRRAEALFRIGRFAEAIPAFAEVRDSDDDDTFTSPSALRVVQAMEEQLRLNAATGALDACDAVRAGLPAASLVNPRTGRALLDSAVVDTCQTPPVGTANAAASAGTSNLPSTSTTNVRRLAIPTAIGALIEARDAYVRRVAPFLDTREALGEVAAEGFLSIPLRAAFAYVNARTFFRFGHAAEAEARYRDLLRGGCAHATVALPAFADLYGLLMAEGRSAERDALATWWSSLRCRAVSPEPPVPAILAAARVGLNYFHRGERAVGAEQIAFYERAGRQLRSAVDEAPRHPEAPLALFYAALAYERANLASTSLQLYLRVLQDYPLDAARADGSAAPPLEGQPRIERINILEFARLRAARNAERMLDWDEALRNYTGVITEPLSNTARDHSAHARDARAAIARITAWQRLETTSPPTPRLLHATDMAGANAWLAGD